MKGSAEAVVRSLIFMVMLPVGAAQTVVGTWQGTLPVGEGMRVILRITENGDGSLRGVVYRSDVGNSSIPLSAVTFAAPSLKVSSTVIETSYEGRLGSDGRSLTGTWTQEKKSYPLTMVLATAETLWSTNDNTRVKEMDPAADPAFEVATIKPSPPDPKPMSIRGTRRFEATSVTVSWLMRYAWQVRSRQILGGPGWLDEERFDIVAEPDAEGEPSPGQVRGMVKKLLAERFHLAVHAEQKVFPVYNLVVERASTNLLKSDPAVNRFARIVTKGSPDGSETLAEFRYYTMVDLTNLLMNFLKDRQIMDETGLVGTFDFDLTLPMSALDPKADAGEAMSAFSAALRERLGMKLMPAKAPLEVVVIDRLEKPSGN